MVRDGIVNLNHTPTQSQSNLLSCFLQISINLTRFQHNTHQRAEPSRSLSLSKLDNKKSIFSTFFFIFYQPTCSYNHLYNAHQQSLPLLHMFSTSYLTSLQVDKTILKIPSKTPFLYTSTFLQFFSYSYSHPYSFHRKSFPLLQPFSQLRLFQWPNQRRSLVKSETVVISPCFSEAWAVITTPNTHSHWFHIAQTHKIGKGLFQLVVSVEDACNRNDKAPTPPLTFSIYYHYFNILLIDQKNSYASWKPVARQQQFLSQVFSFPIHPSSSPIFRNTPFPP